MKFRAFIAGVVFSLTLPAYLSAQDYDSTRQGMLNGQVLVYPGSPPPGRAQVTLYTSLHILLEEIHTSASGTFSFHSVGPGNYLIVAKLAGYQDGSSDVAVYKGNTLTTIGPIVLKPLPSSTLTPTEGIVQTAELRLNKRAREHYERAKQALDQGKLPEAREHLQQVLQTEPTFVEAHYLLGVAESLTGNYAKAQAAFERATQLDPRRSDFYFGLGKTLNLQNHAEEALVAVKKGLELAPDSPLGLYEKSRAQFSLQDFAGAERTARESLQHAPPPPSEVHLILANCYLRTRRYAEAATELDLYLKLEPNSTSAPKARETLGKLKAAGFAPEAAAATPGVPKP